MQATLQGLYQIIVSKQTLLGIMLLAFFFKLILLVGCIRFSIKATAHRILYFFLSVFILGMLLNDAAYMLRIFIESIGECKEDLAEYTAFSRVAWAFYITQYQALALFFEQLHKKYFKITFLHVVQFLINLAITSGFLYLAYFKYGIPSHSPETMGLEDILINATQIYLPVLFVPLIYIIYRAYNSLPFILARQMRYLMNYFVPFFILEMLNSAPDSLINLFAPADFYHGVLITLTSFLSTYPMYFVMKRLVKLRFLNSRKDVASQEKFNFLSEFRDILEQLSAATTVKELAHLNQTFFQTAFNIPLGRTRLYLRKSEPEDDYGYYDIANTSAKVEHFIQKSANNQPMMQALSSSKIFIRDEIEFSYFYDAETTKREILDFLDIINADIFLPLFERNSITAYIIIERNARPGKLFSNKERDEMLVFTSYLSNIINILTYSNTDIIHQRQKQLTEELYHKTQEINKYKESIRSFLRSQKERKIGVIFYKHRRFTFASQAAQQLVGMDLNTNVGHVLTQSCKTVARHAQEFKTTQTTTAHDSQGQKIIIAAIPSLEEKMTILLIYYPEISDIIRTQFDQLKDPASWDYVLYLETTEAGKLINQLIPGAGEKLLNFKIHLLSTALSNRALLIDMAEPDLMPMVEILHHISQRQTLHILKLTSLEKNDDVAIKLFGLNPLLQKDAPESLLLKLNDTGTLFIQNIEYLSLDTQKRLADYLIYGFFQKFKSDHKLNSNVRILCSSAKNLLDLVHAGSFSKTFYDELHTMSVILPSLQNFSETDIAELSQGYAEQIETTQTYKNLLALTEKDKQKLADERPGSFHELKEKVHHLLVQKSTKHKIHETTHFDPAYNVTEPDIAHAVRLGKKALTDPHIMGMLWNKFKNQNKIATLLGVNRSSVNRRCQEYNLR